MTNGTVRSGKIIVHKVLACLETQPTCFYPWVPSQLLGVTPELSWLWAKSPEKVWLNSMPVCHCYSSHARRAPTWSICVHVERYPALLSLLAPTGLLFILFHTVGFPSISCDRYLHLYLCFLFGFSMGVYQALLGVPGSHALPCSASYVGLTIQCWAQRMPSH